MLFWSFGQQDTLSRTTSATLRRRCHGYKSCTESLLAYSVLARTYTTTTTITVSRWTQTRGNQDAKHRAQKTQRFPLRLQIINRSPIPPSRSAVLSPILTSRRLLRASDHVGCHYLRSARGCGCCCRAYSGSGTISTDMRPKSPEYQGVDRQELRLPRLLHFHNTCASKLLGLRQFHAPECSSGLCGPMRGVLQPAVRFLLRQHDLPMQPACARIHSQLHLLSPFR